MFSGSYTQYPDLQMPSWNELDCEDEHAHVNVDFEPNLLHDLEKSMADPSSLSSTNLNSVEDSVSTNNPSSTNSSTSTTLPSSSGTSMTSASSLNTQMFDTADLLNLNPFTKSTSLGEQHLIKSGLINNHNNNNNNNNSINKNYHENLDHSPASSCVSPNLTSTLDGHNFMKNMRSSSYHNSNNYINNDIKNRNRNQNQISYQLSSQSVPSSFSLPNTNNIMLKDEGHEFQIPSVPSSSVVPSSTSTTSTTKKPKESKGRVKKPMTLVQRKAHNKIERKYRININSKIANLQRLVPWMSDDGVAFEIDSKNGKKFHFNDTDSLNDDENSTSPNSNKKLNKSMILDMVTEYLLLLKDECRKKDSEISRLKEQLSSNNINPTTTNS